jgi:hypothetical protein
MIDPENERIQSALNGYFCEFNALRLLDQFHQPGLAPEPGVLINFLSTRVPVEVSPEILAPRAGKLEGKPNPGNWHADIAEWAAALRSVVMARDSYRIVELGCGWGCWITNMGVAARLRGLDVDLIGIEGDSSHLDNARRTLELNGFAEGNDFRLYHGIAGPQPGKAAFPREAGESWGGRADFYPDPEALAAYEVDDAWQVLDCLTLQQLSEGKPIDLLHIDIQGAEHDYVLGNFDAIEAYVKRVLIGTHGRTIEGDLMRHFLQAGWTLEMERPAIVPIRDGVPRTRIDGVQMWANPNRTTEV